MVRFRSLKRDGLVVDLASGRIETVRWGSFAPLALCLGILTLAALLDYASRSNVHRAFLVNQDSEIVRPGLSQALQTSLDEIARDPLNQSQTALPSVDIFLDSASLDQALTQRRESLVKPTEKKKVRAFVRTSDTPFLECGVTVRGYSSWHHQPEKPSLRLRFSKKRASLGYRWLELSRPEDALAVANLVPELVADRLGLPHNHISLVRLFLNRQDKGVYHRSLRLGDRLALENGRLPGTFFSGEGLDLTTTLWDAPDDWSLVGEDDEAVRDWFREFLQLVAATSEHPTRRAELGQYLDEESFARHVALTLYLGSRHSDDRHNQLFFASSYRGLLQPVVWDVNGLGLLGGEETVDNHPDVYLNQLVGLAYWDPQFVHRRNEWLYQLTSTTWCIELLDEKLDEVWSELKSDYAPHQIAFPPTEFSLRQGGAQLLMKADDVPLSQLEDRRQEVKAWVESRRLYLLDYLRDAKVATRADGSKTIVSSFGEVAVRADRVDGSSSLILYSGRSREMIFPQGKLATAGYHPPAPRFYQLDGQPEDWRFYNAITGDALESEEQLPQPVQSLYGLRTPPKELKSTPKTLKLGPGLVTLDRDVVVDRETHLKVEPGTELQLADDVTLICRGKVTMVGTKAAPIVFRPKDTAFGTINLLGVGTRGSRLEHVEVFGGTTARKGGLNLKGMFNAYLCPDLSIKNCTFRGNSVGDDAINVALSTVIVEDSVFSETPMDALDLDGCRAEIKGCVFIDVGNDGLDIMETELQLENCHFANCEDKGISIGEESKSQISGSQFSHCETGLELKDSSRTEVQDSKFSDCRTAVRAYRKKWLFRTGGFGVLRECRLENNRNDIDVDEHSQLWLQETPAKFGEEFRERVHLQGHFGLGRGPSVKPEVLFDSDEMDEVKS